MFTSARGYLCALACNGHGSHGNGDNFATSLGYAAHLDNHMSILSGKPTEAVLQEWLHDQIASCTDLVVAKQADASMESGVR